MTDKELEQIRNKPLKTFTEVELIKEIDRLREYQEAHPCKGVSCPLCGEGDLEVVKLKEALKKYGRHMLECASIQNNEITQCDCGLDELIGQK